MRLVIKILLGLFTASVLLVSAVVLYLAYFFDANQYRNRLVLLVQQKTGRSFSIESIHVAVYPTLGLKLKNAVLGNAPGFPQTPFAVIGEAEIGVQLRPLLLHHQVEANRIYLSRLQATLQKTADGRANWADLAGKPGAPPAAAVTPAPGSPAHALAVNIKGVQIDHSSLTFTDETSHHVYALSDFTASTGTLTPGLPARLHIDTHVQSQAPALQAHLSVAGTVEVGLHDQHDRISALQLTVAAEGIGLPGGVQKLVLAGDAEYDGATQIAQLHAFHLDLDAQGPAVPGGQQHVALTGEAGYDGKNGTAGLRNGRIEFAGLQIRTGVGVGGLNEADPRVSAIVHVDPFDPRRVAKALGKSALVPENPEVFRTARLDARVYANKRSLSVREIAADLDGSHMSGEASVRDLQARVLGLGLHVDQIDLDRYFAHRRASPAVGTPSSPAPPPDANAIQIPVQAIDAITANAGFGIDTLRVKHLTFTHAQCSLAAARGAPKRAQLSAELYGGHVIDVTDMQMAARPGYSTRLQLTHVNAGALLRDLSGKDRVTGIANLTFSGTGSGTTVGAVRRSLNGDVSLKLSDGSVKGVDLANILRQGRSLLSGQLAPDNGSQQTDFSEIDASGKIINGVLVDALNGASPLLRLQGSGSVDLVGMTLDYTVKPTIVNTMSGQGGKGLDQLTGLTIPVRFTGPIASPHYALDVKAALEQKLVQKLTQKLPDLTRKLPPDLQDQLRSLFGGKH